MTTTVDDTVEPASLQEPRRAAARTMKWAVVGALTTLAVLAGVTVARGRSDRADEKRVAREAVAFRDELDPLVKKGGNVVAIGLKPGFTDIRDERYAPAVLQGMADSWVSDLESVRTAIEEIDHDAVLDPTHRLYVRALDGYVQVAATLQKAVAASGDQRQALLAKAASLARSADRTYDRAEEALTRLAGPIEENER